MPKQKHFEELSHYICSEFEVNGKVYTIRISLNRSEEGYIEVRSEGVTLSFVGTIDEDFNTKIDDTREIYTVIDKYIQTMIDKWR